MNSKRWWYGCLRRGEVTTNHKRRSGNTYREKAKLRKKGAAIKTVNLTEQGGIKNPHTKIGKNWGW